MYIASECPLLDPMHFSTFLCISLDFSSFLCTSLHLSTFLCIFLHFSVILYISQHAFPSYVICLCTIPVTRVLIGGVGPPLYSPMHNAGRGLGSRNGMYRCRYYNVLCYQNGKIRIITRDDQPTDSRLLVVGKNWPIDGNCHIQPTRLTLLEEKNSMFDG